MIKRIQALLLIIAASLAMPVLADNHATQPGVRAEAAVIEARVLAINYETREASLELPYGHVVSLIADPSIENLSEIKVGDLIIATYFSSLAGEVREPTEEELAEPFLILADEMTGGADGMPGRGGAMLIRAVCTIEGMNRITGRAMIKDSRGQLHVIEDVPAERFEGVTLGQTVIMTYTQAVAVALEKQLIASEIE